MNNHKIILSIRTMNRCGSPQMTVQGALTSRNRENSYPQSPNLWEAFTVSDAKVVGGGGTDVTCCQVGTKICCARLDQVCGGLEEQSSASLHFLFF